MGFMGRKSKKSLNVFSIFFNSIGIYFSYLDKLTKYLLFPVFGQILGLIAIFTIVYFLNVNVNVLTEKFPIFAFEQNLFILYICLILPFLIVLLKAFYDYMIAFSALNTVSYTLLAKKKVKDLDFPSHNANIIRRLPSYLGLLLIFSFITTVLIIPPILLVAPILFVYLVLIFQVFALEQQQNPFYPISRSVSLVKGHFWKTSILLILVSVFSYFLIPGLIIWSCNYFGWTFYLINPVEKFVSLFPIDSWNATLAQFSFISFSVTELDVARTIVESLISSIIIMFMLPFRCCAFTYLYASLDSENIKNNASDSENDKNG